jgi:hypothetical protein
MTTQINTIEYDNNHIMRMSRHPLYKKTIISLKIIMGNVYHLLSAGLFKINLNNQFLMLKLDIYCIKWFENVEKNDITIEMYFLFNMGTAIIEEFINNTLKKKISIITT